MQNGTIHLSLGGSKSKVASRNMQMDMIDSGFLEELWKVETSAIVSSDRYMHLWA
jgi:hypothetical protein